MRRFLVALALVPSLLGAQQLRQMTRSISTTGLNDSALTLISDSASRTRAGSIAQLRKALSTKAFDSLLTPLLRMTGPLTITSASANAFAVGRVGTTNPALNIDASTALSANGLSITPKAAGNGVYLGITSSATDDSLVIVPRGAGNIVIGSSTGVFLVNPVSQYVGNMTAFANITSGSDTASVAKSISFNTVAAMDRRLRFLTAGVLRWRLGVNTNAEAGADAGADFVLQAYTDAGAAIDVPVTITRASGGAITSTRPIVGTNGTASAPTLGFTGTSSNTGIYRFGVDTIGFSVDGANAFIVPAVGKIVGNAGNFTFTSGTGASRTLTLQTTNSGSTAINTLVLGADSTVTPLGKIVPNSVKGIKGTTTNDTPDTNAVGFLQSHSTAANTNSLTTNTPANVDSLTLTAGDWEVGGVVSFTGSATTSITMLAGGTNTTSATVGSLGTYTRLENAAEVPGVTTDIVLVVPTTQYLLSTPTKVYLVVNQTFTASTLKSGGVLRARRVR